MKDTDIFILLYRYLTESYGTGQDIDDRIVEGIEFSLIELKCWWFNFYLCIYLFNFDMSINSK